MSERLEPEIAFSGAYPRNVERLLFFSTISVAALLTLKIPDTIGFNFVLLQVIARISVPLLLMVASYDFFIIYRDSKCLLLESTSLFRKGIIIYLVFAVSYLTLNYLMPFWLEGWQPSYNPYIYFLRGLFAGEPPCSWMILSYLVGIILVCCLQSLRQRPLTILLIAFICYTISISTEIYFNAIMKINLAAHIWGMYSKLFITTRNGLFYGFFWCALGYFLTFKAEVTFKKNLIFFGVIAGIAMTIEHSLAHSMGWARDYKSSFMLIPVCVFIFLLASKSARSAGRFIDLQSLFNKQMFIAFMILPLIALGIERMGVPRGALLFSLTLSADFAISYVLAIFSDKISIKGFRLIA